MPGALSGINADDRRPPTSSTVVGRAPGPQRPGSPQRESHTRTVPHLVPDSGCPAASNACMSELEIAHLPSAQGHPVRRASRLAIPFSRRPQAPPHPPSPSANFTATAIWVHIANATNNATGPSPLALRLRRQQNSTRLSPIPRLVSGPSYRGPGKRGDRLQPRRRLLTAAPTSRPIYTSDPARKAPFVPPLPPLPRLASNHVQFPAADAAEPELPGADGLPAQHGRVIHAATGAGVHGMCHTSLLFPRLSEATRAVRGPSLPPTRLVMLSSPSALSSASTTHHLERACAACVRCFSQVPPTIRACRGGHVVLGRTSCANQGCDAGLGCCCRPHGSTVLQAKVGRTSRSM